MSRLRAVLVPCAGCGSLGHAQAVGGRVTLPAGWLRLHVWTNDSTGAAVRSGVVDVCSAACAASGLEQQVGRTEVPC
jgi:hypothetical protein